MRRKKILIICINYNSYNELYNYLKSIEDSLLNISGECEINVYVADNSIPKKDINIPNCLHFKCYIVKLDNWGYLGGASYIINNIVNVREYDYVIISNVDLILDKNTINCLLRLELSKDIAWIAPTLYSAAENRDKNPKIIKRYSVRRLKMLRLMYKYPFLHQLYIMSFYKRKKKKKQHIEHQFIYAGHGSFIILTKSFFLTYTSIDYPIFLFGEEIFLAELIQKAHKKVLYEPSIKIWDLEHISTSTIKKGSYYHYNYQAITFILKRFYE